MFPITFFTEQRRLRRLQRERPQGQTPLDEGLCEVDDNHQRTEGPPGLRPQNSDDEKHKNVQKNCRKRRRVEI